MFAGERSSAPYTGRQRRPVLAVQHPFVTNGGSSYLHRIQQLKRAAVRRRIAVVAGASAQWGYPGLLREAPQIMARACSLIVGSAMTTSTICHRLQVVRSHLKQLNGGDAEPLSGRMSSIRGIPTTSAEMPRTVTDVRADNGARLLGNRRS